MLIRVSWRNLFYYYYRTSCELNTAWKVSKYEVFSGPYFDTFHHGFCPSPPTIIMGGLNLKISQNFVGTNFFSCIYVGSIYYYRGKYLLLWFHYFISLETSNTQKSAVFFFKFFQEMWMHQVLLLVNILKLIKKVLKKNFTFCAFWLFTYRFAQVCMIFCYHIAWMG